VYIVQLIQATSLPADNITASSGVRRNRAHIRAFFPENCGSNDNQAEPAVTPDWSASPTE